MSTKTSIKRIALVAVSALGLGLLAAVPSSAAPGTKFNASFSTSTSTISLLEGYDTTTAKATVTLNMATTATNTFNVSNDDMTVTISAATATAAEIAAVANQQARNDAAILALSGAVSTAQGTANTTTNGVVVFGNDGPGDTTLTATLDAVSNAYSTATGSFSLYVPSVLTSASTANGGKVKLSVTDASNGLITTFDQYITLKVGTFIAGARTISPSTGVANIAAGGSATLSVTQAYTAKASAALVSAEVFTLSTTNVPGATLSVTAAATGGIATVVPTAANQYTVSLLKDVNAGAMSITYTLTVSAPASATQGQTMTVDAFTLTVFGGAVYNGTILYPTRAQTGGWLGGDNVLYGPATAGTSIGTIFVDANTAATPQLNPAWTFTMTGVGNFDLGEGRVSYAAVPAGAAASKTATIYADGRAGSGTLTITSNGNVVATQVVKFYGAAASIKVTPVYTIAKAGNGIEGYETGSLVHAACTPVAFTPAECATVTTNDPSLVVEVLDALGTRMPVGVGTAGGVVMTSSNTAVIATGATDTFLDAGVPTKTAGTLLNHVTYSTAPTAKSGDSATLTFSLVNSLGATITATQKVTVGGSTSGGTVTMKLDKTTYAPGERMVLTVTGKDSSGNPVYDNRAVGSFSSNKAVQGLTTGFYADGAYIYGDDAGEDLFAPAASGSFDIILYTGTASGASIKVTATVSDDAATAAANAAADAAAEAIDAANAATDAANLAAEAADAATVAAEEARDAADAATAAVEALAAQFATLMAALKAQIQTLANTVAKIAKKVKA